MPSPSTQAGKKLSRPPLLRIQRIHEAVQGMTYPNCRKLAEKLDVSTKTVQRDIEFMRSQLGVPLEYDAEQHGYYYTEEVGSLPTIPVSEGEVLALFVAGQALSQYRGTPFEEPLASAFAKLSQGLKREITFSPGTAINSPVSFSHVGVSEPPLETFRTLAQAVMEARELTFDYHKLHAPRPARRSVRPYHIRCIENQWYLFAYDLGRKDLRTFVLNRIVHLGKPGARFEKPADFDIEERLRSCFGVFRETHTYKVRIRFDAFAARLVAERAWHPSQVLKTFRNGEVELSFTLSSLIEVERWVLSWGRHATVQTPKELRERIRENVAELAARYEPRDGVPAEPRQAFLFGDDKPARQLLFDLNPRKSTRLAALDGLQEIEDSLADLN